MVRKIGYPVLIRAAYALGGFGSGFAENEHEFRMQAEKSFAYSNQLIIDQVRTSPRDPDLRWLSKLGAMVLKRDCSFKERKHILRTGLGYI